MIHHTAQSQPLSFGLLTWEYFPKQYNSQSFARFALVLILLGLILIYLGMMTASIGMMMVAIVFLIPACIFIGLAFRVRKHRILFYERGLEDIQAGKVRSSSYEHLKIWQYTATKDISGASRAFLHSYIVGFPDNSRLRSFDPELGERLQQFITECQTDLVIAEYKRGENIDFGPIRLNQQGIASSLDTLGKMTSSLLSSGIFFYPTSSNFNKKPHCKVISWSDIATIRMILGTLYVTQSNGKTLSVEASNIPNIFVLMNLLQHLGY
jgi:hypothetical protein